MHRSRRPRRAVEDIRAPLSDGLVEDTSLHPVVVPSGVPHPIARCRWCGGPFFPVFTTWWACAQAPCVARQMAHAIWGDPRGEAPIFLPLPLQVEIQESQAKRLLVAGAGGASKSYGGRRLLYSECRRYAGYRALLLRCTYDELSKNHLQYMPMEAEAFGARYLGGNQRQMIFEKDDGNDSMIFMGFCENARDIVKHLGNDWDLTLFDEGVHFLPAALSEISARDRGSLTCVRPLGQVRDGRTIILTNPGGRAMRYLIDHYITRTPDLEEYPRYVARIHGFIPATRFDNPYLSENYMSETLSGLSAARFKQLAYGDWTVYAGQFFSSFSSATHVVEMEPA